MSAVHFTVIPACACGISFPVSGITLALLATVSNAHQYWRSHFLRSLSWFSHSPSQSLAQSDLGLECDGSWSRVDAIAGGSYERRTKDAFRSCRRHLSRSLFDLQHEHGNKCISPALPLRAEGTPTFDEDYEAGNMSYLLASMEVRKRITASCRMSAAQWPLDDPRIMWLEAWALRCPTL